MLITYIVCAVLMFALWFGVAWKKMYFWERPSWPVVWVACIIAGLFWPATLAYIVLYAVVEQWG